MEGSSEIDIEIVHCVNCIRIEGKEMYILPVEKCKDHCVYRSDGDLI